MDDQTNDFLLRWQLLENGDGLRIAASRVNLLKIASVITFFVAVFGVTYGLHPAAIGIAGLATGWLIAEGNALRDRIDKWPIIKRYIDWQRVNNDLHNRELHPQNTPR